MVSVTVEQIQQDTLKYLHQVEAGEALIIVRGDRPIAELKPIQQQQEQLRHFGLCAGEFVVPDDFDAPLPEDILSAFEGVEKAQALFRQYVPEGRTLSEELIAERRQENSVE